MRLGSCSQSTWGVCALWGEGNEQPLTLSAWPQERYYVLYIRPSRIHRRKFDPKGNEIEPNFSATRKVNTGFLMSSYSRCPLPFLPRGRPTLAFLCLQRSLRRHKVSSQHD